MVQPLGARENRDLARPLVIRQATSSQQRGTGCFFLEILPREIRQEVYKYILTNPILGEFRSISREGALYPDVTYDIWPQILRVSKQIYAEASQILYGLNKFFILCVGPPPRTFRADNNSELPVISQCPLTRHLNSSYNFTTLAQIAAVKHVKQWRVVVTAFTGENRFSLPQPCPPPEFSEFCREICTSQPISIEVLIVKEGIESHADDGNYYFSSEKMKTALRPLRLMRGLTTLEFTDAGEDDIPRARINPAVVGNRIRSRLPSPSFTSEIRAQVTGNSPVEFVHKMYADLLSYAQAFERYAPFKLEMGLGYVRSGALTLNRYQKVDSKYLEHHTSGPVYHRYVTSGSWNPFRLNDNSHPIEEALARAKLCIQKDDVLTFKKERRRILEYLEEQYQRILERSAMVNEFVKEHKVEFGLLDARNNLDWDDRFNYRTSQLSSLILLLEDYADSFKREIPFTIRSEIRRQKSKFEGYYAAMPRERWLNHIGIALEHEEFSDIFEILKKIIDDMDTQYVAIRKARKELFSWDVEMASPKRCSIEVQEWRCDELVDWSVNEPHIFAVPRYDKQEELRRHNGW